MKIIKQFFTIPFYGLFFLGCAIAMSGWIVIELINGEWIKEIKIVKDERTETEQKA